MLLGAVIASMYGAIHDQISYTISPEYFTKYKFFQFSYADFSLPDRVYASIVGVLATAWFGVLCGWYLGRIRYYSDDLMSAKKDILSGFYVVFSLALLASVVGGVVGCLSVNYFTSNVFLGWEEVLTLNELKFFIIVGYIHAAGYIGGFSGIIYSSYLIKKKMKAA